jgi:hypothetical protein
LGRAAVEGLSADSNPFGRVVVEGTAETLGEKFRRAFPNDPPLKNVRYVSPDGVVYECIAGRCGRTMTSAEAGQPERWTARPVLTR